MESSIHVSEILCCGVYWFHLILRERVMNQGSHHYETDEEIEAHSGSGIHPRCRGSYQQNTSQVFGVLAALPANPCTEPLTITAVYTFLIKLAFVSPRRALPYLFLTLQSLSSPTYPCVAWLASSLTEPAEAARIESPQAVPKSSTIIASAIFQPQLNCS